MDARHLFGEKNIGDIYDYDYMLSKGARVPEWVHKERNIWRAMSKREKLEEIVHCKLEELIRDIKNKSWLWVWWDIQDILW